MRVIQANVNFCVCQVNINWELIRALISSRKDNKLSSSLLLLCFRKFQEKDIEIWEPSLE